MPQGLNPYDIRIKCAVPPLCYDFSDVDEFLGQAATKEALGVDPSRTWESCNYTVNGMFGDDWMKSMEQNVPTLLSLGVRVLIYAGDVDFICNWLGNKAWALGMPWPHSDEFAKEGDHPWVVAGEGAGFARSAANFTFLQVSNAGHMVPLDKPQQALAMVNAFLANKTFY